MSVRIYELWLMVSGLRFECKFLVSGFGFRVSGFGGKVLGEGCRVWGTSASTPAASSASPLALSAASLLACPCRAKRKPLKRSCGLFNLKAKARIWPLLSYMCHTKKKSRIWP